MKGGNAVEENKNPEFDASGNRTDRFGYLPPSPPLSLSPGEQSGSRAKLFGILSIVFTVVCCCCFIVGPILGVLAIIQSANSKRELGELSPDAYAGRILGIISIAIFALTIIACMVMYLTILIPVFSNTVNNSL